MSSEQQNRGFNWGKGLFVVIVLFICTTLGIVAFLVSLDYEMVTEDHYKKAVEYQNHIDKVEHTSKLSKPITLKLLQGDQKIRIKFPASLYQKGPDGIIKLYRPSDSDLDQQIELALNDQGIQDIPTRDLARGKWLIRVNWMVDSTGYFKEENIFL